MNLPRVSLYACLVVFLLFPALWLGLDVTGTSTNWSYQQWSIFAWLAAVVALLFLSGAYLEQEPDMVRVCLTTMGLLLFLYAVAALALPAICRL